MTPPYPGGQDFQNFEWCFHLSFSFLGWLVYENFFLIISPFKKAWSLISTTLNFFCLRVFCAKFDLNWPIGSGDVKNVKVYIQEDGRTDVQTEGQTYKQTYRRTDRQTDGKQNVIIKVQLSFRLRWATKGNSVIKTYELLLIIFLSFYLFLWLSYALFYLHIICVRTFSIGYRMKNYTYKGMYVVSNIMNNLRYLSELSKRCARLKLQNVK